MPKKGTLTQPIILYFTMMRTRNTPFLFLGLLIVFDDWFRPWARKNQRTRSRTRARAHTPRPKRKRSLTTGRATGSPAEAPSGRSGGFGGETAGEQTRRFQSLGRRVSRREPHQGAALSRDDRRQTHEPGLQSDRSNRRYLPPLGRRRGRCSARTGAAPRAGSGYFAGRNRRARAGLCAHRIRGRRTSLYLHDERGSGHFDGGQSCPLEP